MSTDVSVSPLVENRLHLYDRESHMKFLVDSGSVVSLLPRVAVNKRLSPKKFALYAANSTTIITYGQQIFTLNLSWRRAFKWTFIVADVQTAILGADFLAHFDLMVDVKRRRLVDPLTALAVQDESVVASVYSVTTSRSVDTPAGVVGLGYSRLLNEFAALSSPCTSAALLEGSPVQHHIVTTGPPVVERHRRLTDYRLAAAKQEFNTLLVQGIIRTSLSQWASPLHLAGAEAVRRMACHGRLSTPQLHFDSGSLPTTCYRRFFPGLSRMHSFLENRSSTRILSDPRRAGRHTEDGCSTPFGLYEFVRMPLGLRNSAQKFQRFMDSLRRKIPFIRCYLDDLLVVSDSHEEHMQHLRQLFEVIRQARLSINLDKCVFGKDRLIYLGFLINKDGYQPPPNRIKVIEEFLKPANVSQLRRFLGMLNYYRRYIPAAAQKQAPLHDLLQGLPKRSRAALQWAEAAEQAFDKCKRSIIEAVVPAFLAHAAPLALVTDASNSQIGAALEQQEDGAWRPIEFFSRKISDTESRYSTYDRELLAVYAAIKFFQQILEGKQFTIKTEHRPLFYAADQRADRASPRQQRQLDYILQFNVEWAHIKGEDNVVADTLSRTCTVSMPTQLDLTAISQG